MSVHWNAPIDPSPYILAASNNSDSKVHGANMGPTWGLQDPGGTNVGHVNLAIWEVVK